MKQWIASKQELEQDYNRMLICNSGYDPNINNCNLKRYNDSRHPNEGALPSYRIAYEWEGSLRVITPSPRMLYMLIAGNTIRNIRVIADDPETGRPIFEGVDELLPPMTEKQAVEFIAWRDVPRGCNRVEIITTEELPTNRIFRQAWKLRG